MRFYFTSVCYSAGISRHCSCHCNTQGHTQCHPATFLPTMLHVSTMHLRMSIRGTLFSRFVSRQPWGTLVDIHSLLKCQNSGLNGRFTGTPRNWGILVLRPSRTLLQEPQSEASLSILHIHCFTFRTSTPYARFLFLKLAHFFTKGTLCDFHFLQSVLLTAHQRSHFL